MSTDDIARYQKDAITGHPADLEDGHDRRPAPRQARSSGLLRRRRGRSARPVPRIRRSLERASRRAPSAAWVCNAERKAFDVLGLEVDATAHDVRDPVQGSGQAPPSRRQRR
jgi:hypothetical protein